MTNRPTPHALPRTVDCAGAPLTLRLMGAGDEAAMLAFSRALAPHDLLFLRRDITQPKVVRAWLKEIEAGAIVSILALEGAAIVGCAAVVRDPLSWSAHVAELRVVIAESMRGRGLGVLLAQEAFALALAMGAEKLTAQMTLDQKSAMATFEGLGFAMEAMLRDHVKDRAGAKHDVVVMSGDIARLAARHAAYGLDEAV
jgi:RimJ/RimL family protein N-acetyltransferase